MGYEPSEYDISIYMDPREAAEAILRLENRVRMLEQKLEAKEDGCIQQANHDGRKQK